MKIFNKNSWFTFVEILLSTAISVIVLIFTFPFLVETMSWISKSQQKVTILSSFYDVSRALKTYKNIYQTWSVFVDNLTSSWNDVLLFRNSWPWPWVIFWIIDKSTMNFFTWSLYDYYWDKVFWYKELSTGQLNNILLTPTKIYNINFTNSDFFNFPVKSFQVDYYNSWTILDFNIEFLSNYNSSLTWQLWQDIPTSAYDLFKLNLNF